MANLITGQTHHYGLGEAARSWGGSAVLGVSPMSDCRGLPHERFASRSEVDFCPGT
ncbi:MULTISPECIES: hypothetical protein [Moorena]|uniref:hypothetical protein n=1 Tax=Moorena TaxID=1155738 RepID=UPI0012B551F0|nr:MULTISPECIES: hypothetical protein [Moorena]NEQ05436.1 hypothetical protein [Moorena sp. SIO4E2]NER89906.1 hypothetical protein [Moorena sp. SIO3A2]NET69054.1 hypothetical protein [Moorena sp. SIO1G6]